MKRFKWFGPFVCTLFVVLVFAVAVGETKTVKKPAKAESFQTFTITVDETKTVEELVRWGDFKWKDVGITNENFPSPANGQKVEKRITLFHFDTDMSSDAVLNEIHKVGCRQATIRDLICLAIQEPDLQKKFYVVGLGSVYRWIDGERYVPCICMHLSGRGLNLSRYDSYKWPKGIQFAAVSNK